MVTKIGSMVMLFLCMNGLASQKPVLQLKVTTMDGKATKAMVVGMPYLLEIVGKNLSSLGQLTIPGLQELYHESRGAYQTIQTVNGVTQRSSKLTYYIRPERVGMYTLGPVEIEVDNKKIVSDVLTLEASVRSAKNKKNEKLPALYAEVAVSKKDLFVGEPLHITYTLYARDTMHVVQHSQPHMNYQDKELVWEKVDQGTKTLQEKSYSYVQWRTSVTPNQVEQLVIPALSVACVVQKGGSGVRDFMGRMLQQFGFANKTVEVFSDPVVLSINPLPPCQNLVDAIGVVDDVWLECNPAKARIGEGIVTTLYVVCSESTGQIKHPPLYVPSQLRYYPSKMTSKPSRHSGRRIDSFEYIVQGIATGQVTIDSQAFTYFDPERREYATRHTEPIILTIEKLPVVASANAAANASVLQEETGYKKLNQRGPWLAQPSRPISWYVFFMLVLIPLCIFAQSGIQTIMPQGKKNRVMRVSHVVALCKKRINELEKQNRAEELYALVMELFAQRWNLSINEVTQERIATFLQKKLPSDHVEKWQMFLKQASQAAYGHSAIDRHLFEQAHEWLTILQKVLV